jgi:cyclopropane fatty-acyl-phospholipid synthase-like methyltransferase
LYKNGVDLEAVDLSQDLLNFVKLPKERVHTADVLEFKPDKSYDRIIAGFNSFCLFTEAEDIQRFFNKLASLLNKNGKASLSYYHTDFWSEAKPYSFTLDGETIQFIPDFDLTNKNRGFATWIDRFQGESFSASYEYPLKTYDNPANLEPYLQKSGLKLIDKIWEFNKKREEVFEPGWIDYVIAKH